MGAFSQWAKTKRRGAGFSYFETEGDYICKIVSRGSRETRHDQPMFYCKFEIVEVLKGGDKNHEEARVKDWSRVLEKTPKGNLTDKGGYALEDMKALIYAIGGGDPEFEGEEGLDFALEFFALDKNANSLSGKDFDPAIPEDEQPMILVKCRINETDGKSYANLYFDALPQ